MFKRTLMSLALLASLAGAETLKDAVEGYLSAAEGSASSPWTVTGKFGVALTDGNSETLTVNAGIDASNEWDPWKLALKVVSLYAEDSGDESANEHIFTEQLNRKIDEKSSIFQFFLFEHDGQENLDYRILFTLGYERQLVKKDNYDLKADVGAGVLHEEYTATNTTEGIAQIGFTVVWKITDKLTYNGRIIFFPSLSQGGEFRAVFLNTLTTPISERADFRLEVNDKYNSAAPAGSEKNDIQVIFALSVNFTKDRK